MKYRNIMSKIGDQDSINLNNFQGGGGKMCFQMLLDTSVINNILGLSDFQIVKVLLYCQSL